MSLDLNYLLNSTPVSPPHSNPARQQSHTTPSSTELSSAILEKSSRELLEYHCIPLSQDFNFNLISPVFKDSTNHRITKQIYQKPISITSFSYDPQHHIQCSHQQFQSIRPLLDSFPRNGFDLNHGLDQAIFQDQSLDSGLDGLLISLFDLFDKNKDSNKHLDHARGLLSTTLITWRGIITKFCSSVYETGGSNGWNINVMMIDGTLYIEDGEKEDINKDIYGKGRATYYGYSYESLITNENFLTVNTNQQWVAVVKSNLNGYRLVLGGEVDAIDQHQFQLLSQNPSNFYTQNISPDHFVEIKTCINPVSDRDFFNLYRFKLLKYWLQSYLLGTPKIHVGLRDRNGTVCGTKNYKTINIPSIVEQQGKPATRWSSNTCLENGTRIIRMILNKLQSDMNENQNKKKQEEEGRKKYSNRLNFFQDELNSIIKEEYEYQKQVVLGTSKSTKLEELSNNCKIKINQLIDWPVYKLTFIPKNNLQVKFNSIELKEIDPIEIDDLILKSRPNHLFNYNNSNLSKCAELPDPDPNLNNLNLSHRSFKNRIGFIPLFWLHHLVKLKIDLLLDQL